MVSGWLICVSVLVRPGADEVAERPVAIGRSDAVMVRQFAAGLERWQNPPTCGPNTPLMLFGKHSEGLGSQLVVLKETMLMALESGHVFSTAASQCSYANPLRCASRGFDCYFKAVSNCTVSNAANQALTACHAKSADVPGQTTSAAFSRLLGLNRVPSATWIRARLMQYVMRPNEELKASIAKVEALLGLNAPGAYGKTVAVHVRRGDKGSEAKIHGFAEYVRQIGYLHATSGGIAKIFLGSDGEHAIEHMRHLLNSSHPRLDIELVAMPSGMFMEATPEFATLMRGYQDKRKAYASMGRRALPRVLSGATQVQLYYEEISRRKARPADAKDKARLVDEGMALLTQMMLMARCRFFIGSISSNMGQVIYLLRHGSQFEHFQDIDGSPYYPCASGMAWPFGGGFNSRQTRQPATMQRVKSTDAAPAAQLGRQFATEPLRQHFPAAFPGNLMHAALLMAFAASGGILISASCMAQRTSGECRRHIAQHSL